jgi:putative AdoMet-dependent methyltransferase
MIKVKEMDIDLYRHYSNSLECAAGPRWQYDERKPCGVNYNNTWHARSYDRCHRKFRDYEAEGEDIIAALGLTRNHVVIDMGCGTGAFVIHAAKHFKKVFAVDISKAMLKRARRKARKAELDNIEFCDGGFLTYEHTAEPVDAVVSVAALHHLPDFWKVIGLRRLVAMVKPGGKLYIRDVVFSFDPERYKYSIKAYIQMIVNHTFPAMEREVETHFRQEYSTFGWIMEGMLEKAGLQIESADYKDKYFAAYLCTKRANEECRQCVTETRANIGAQY